jgi:hypothetical protein
VRGVRGGSDDTFDAGAGAVQDLLLTEARCVERLLDHLPAERVERGFFGLGAHRCEPVELSRDVCALDSECGLPLDRVRVVREEARARTGHTDRAREYDVPEHSISAPTHAPGSTCLTLLDLRQIRRRDREGVFSERRVDVLEQTSNICIADQRWILCHWLLVG